MLGYFRHYAESSIGLLHLPKNIGEDTGQPIQRNFTVQSTLLQETLLNIHSIPLFDSVFISVI
jgi:hypothetical protein